MPRVFNKLRPHPPSAVLVDRSTVFGNPFKIGRDGNRQDVIDKYERWIWMPQRVRLRQRMMRELRGKDLLCWCAPEECHADIILKIANAD
jgi:Domain of unknown function (DUF4326)